MDSPTPTVEELSRVIDEIADEAGTSDAHHRVLEAAAKLIFAARAPFSGLDPGVVAELIAWAEGKPLNSIGEIPLLTDVYDFQDIVSRLRTGGPK